MRSLTLGAFLLLVLLSLTSGLASRIRVVDVASSRVADVRQELPEIVGNWEGENIYYCQREQCARSFLASELKDTHICPICEGQLDTVSLGERTILPPDTVISRRLYKDEINESITVTIVISGSEQRSIHRPQQCLPAQGYTIEESAVFAIPLAGRLPLKLTLIRARMKAATTVNLTPKLLMAYWFAGGGHETHDHFQRLMFMAWDNLIHGIRPRWAYVSLQTSLKTGDQATERRLEEFVRQLYPLLKSGPPVAQ